MPNTMTNPGQPWPDNCRGAVSLTFDDGTDSQLDLAVPMLAQYGFPATFYLPPKGKRLEKNLLRWQKAVATGHEIGNHSLSHICSRGFRDTLDDGIPTLETITLEELEADIMAAEEQLRQAFPEHGPRTFGYPCYMSYVGEGANQQSYVPVVAKHFLAGRGKGEWANHPLTCDLHYLWSWPAERLDYNALIGMAETCATQGRWGIFTFHGIGEGHLPIAPYDLERFLDHLNRHRDRIWVATVVGATKRILSWRENIRENTMEERQ